MASEAVFKWALRSVSLSATPEISVEEPLDVYKVFWLVERDDGDVIIDSVDGTERPFEG